MAETLQDLSLLTVTGVVYPDDDHTELEFDNRAVVLRVKDGLADSYPDSEQVAEMVQVGRMEFQSLYDEDMDHHLLEIKDQYGTLYARWQQDKPLDYRILNNPAAPLQALLKELDEEMERFYE